MILPIILDQGKNTARPEQGPGLGNENNRENRNGLRRSESFVRTKSRISFENIKTSIETSSLPLRFEYFVVYPLCSLFLSNEILRFVHWVNGLKPNERWWEPPRLHTR